ncbi:MAG: hypothetical protein M1835_007889 [Candelina submexicana]|nr:MAG: hypothetical protein M1835_007889 [Candelina submexicana]
MVNLWPWKGDDTSPASFEKALSNLSVKISKTTTQLETLRQRQRRLKALWTIYASFAYILYSIILALVVGWKNWDPTEYVAVAGGPAVIYLVRLAFTTYYDYRTTKVQAHLDGLNQQRSTTIDKLKAATKYNTTQQLLEKYGGAPQSSPKPSPPFRGTPSSKTGTGQESPGTPRGGRTGVAPPPTANIPRNNAGQVPSPSTPQRQSSDNRNLPNRRYQQSRPNSPLSNLRQQSSPLEPGPPEFAPNAFSSSTQYSTGTAADRGQWYDRFMDLLLGEDESLPKNRLALICKHCKLVNGQAPPGVKRLDDVGKWRCGGCGGWNGEENEATNIVAEIHEQAKADAVGLTQPRSEGKAGLEGPSSGDNTEDDVVLVPTSDDPSIENEEDMERTVLDSQDEGTDEPEAAPAPKAKRGRPKGSGKKKG